MINVAEIILDPDFAQWYTITRSVNGQFSWGGYQDLKQTLQTYGVIEPATSKDLEQIPEADRVIGMMAFYATIQLYTTQLLNPGVSGISDQITWDSQQWRLQHVKEYQDYGYWKALGVRMSGA